MIRFITLAMLSSLCLPWLHAQTQPSSRELLGNSSLDRFLEYMERNNPLLKRAYRQWQAENTEIDTVTAWPDPKVNLAVMAREVETRVGPQKQKLGATQRLPWPSQLKLAGAAASKEADVARRQMDLLRMDLRRQFRQLWADYYYIGRRVALTEEHLNLLDNLYNVIDTKYRTGATSYSNFVRLELEMDRLENQLTTIKNIAAPIRAELNALLNRPPAEPISFPGALNDAEKDWIDDLSLNLEKRLVDTNPEILLHLIKAEASQAKWDLSKTSSLPNIDVGFEWINTGSATMPGVSGSGDDPFILKFGVTLPIKKKKYRAMEAAAEHRHMADREAYLDAFNKVRARLQRAFFDYEDAGRQHDLCMDVMIPKAMEALRVTSKAFESDYVDYADLIDSERTLLELKYNMARAAADRLKALANIEHIAGVPIPTSRATHH